MGTREDMGKGFNMGCGFIIGMIILIFVFIFILGTCAAVYRAKRHSPPTNATSNIKNGETGETPTPERRIKVLDFNWRDSSARYYRVEGRVQNISSEPISLITIGIDFFNEGKWVGCDKGIDYLENISPGEIRSFSTVARRSSSEANSATLHTSLRRQ